MTRMRRLAPGALAAVIGLAVLAGGAPGARGAGRGPQQEHAIQELRDALGVHLNMYENSPVCMRMRPHDQIIAEVFGRDQRERVRRAFADLRVRATIRVTSIAAYNAGLRRLARMLTSKKPTRFKHVEVGAQQIPTFSSGDSEFVPVCPTVSVFRPTQRAQPGLIGEEDAWVEAAERRYGADRVESSCCDAETPRRSQRPVPVSTHGRRHAPRSGASSAPERGQAAVRDARRQQPTCGPPRAQTVKLSATIRVYRVPTHSLLAPDREYACWRHGGRASLWLGFAGSYGWNAAHTTLLKLAPQTGHAPSSIVAWVQRTEGDHDSMSLRSGNVRTGKLIHETAPPGEGDTISTLESGYFIVTPSGSLAWFGKGGPVDGEGRHTGPEGVWTLDAHGEHLITTGEWTAKPLRWSAGTLYWTIEGPTIEGTPLL
jgi:hypothetical protein